MNEKALNTMYSLAQKEGYNKSKDEFVSLLSTNNKAFNTMYSLAKKEGYNKSEDDFSLLLGLKKKEQTSEGSSRDFTKLGEALGQRMSQSGKTLSSTKDQDKKQSVLKAKEDALILSASKNVEKYATPEAKQQIHKRLIDEGFDNANAERISSFINKAGQDKVNAPQKAAVKEKLWLANNYGGTSWLFKTLVANDDKIEKWAGELREKGISQENIDSEINNIKKQALEKLSNAQEQRYIHKVKENKQDFASQLSMDLRGLLPDDVKEKVALNDKYNALVDEVMTKKREGKLSSMEEYDYKNRLKEIEKLRQDEGISKKLFDPITGRYKGREERNEYEDKVVSFGEQLSDKDKTYDNLKKLYFRFSALDEVYNRDIKYTDSTGKTRYITPKEAYALDPAIESSLTNDVLAIIEGNKGLQREWVNARAKLDAVNRAFHTNADPSEVEKGFFESFGKGYISGVGREAQFSGKGQNDAEFIDNYVAAMDDLGGYVTPEQRESAKRTLKQNVGEAVGNSIPIMRDIAASTLLLETGIGAVGLAKHLKTAKDIVTNKYGKVGKFFFDAVTEGVKGGVAFAPTDETFAGGFGEGVTQGVIDNMFGKYGRTMNRFLKYGIKTSGGAIGETLSEFAGQYLTELSRQGIDTKQAFENTFGRTSEDFTDKLIETLIVSAMFSGAFNGKVFLETRAELEAAYNEGRVPKDKIKDVEEILSSTAQQEQVAEKEVEKELINLENQPEGVGEKVEEGVEDTIEIEETKTTEDDNKDITGVSSTEQEGEKPIEAELNEGTSREEIEAGRDIQEEGQYQEASDEEEGSLEQPDSIEGSEVVESIEEDTTEDEFIEDDFDDKEADELAEFEASQSDVATDEEVEIKDEDTKTEAESVETKDSKEDIKSLSEEIKTIEKDIKDKKLSNKEKSKAISDLDEKKSRLKKQVETELSNRGKKPTKDIKDKKVSERSLIGELKEMKPSTNPKYLYDIAKQNNLVTPEFLKELNVQYKKHYEHQNNQKKKQQSEMDRLAKKEGRKRGGIFQKESTQKKATAQYIDAITSKLKKAFPNIEVAIDSSIEAAATIRDGVVVINPDKAGVDTPIHEFAEIWTRLLNEVSPNEYKQIINLIKNDSVAMADMLIRRPDLRTSDEVALEVLNEAIGVKGAEIESKLSNEGIIKRALKAIIDAIKKAYKVATFKRDDVLNMSLGDFASKAAKEILSGKELTSISSETLNKWLSGEKKIGKMTLSTDFSKGNKVYNNIADYIDDKFRTKSKSPKYIKNVLEVTKSRVQNRLNEYSKKAKIFDKNLRELVRKEKWTNEMVSDFLVSANKSLTNKEGIGVLMNDYGFDAEHPIIESLQDMRDSITKLSKELIESKLLPKSVVAEITNNLDMYLHRSYAIHKIKPKDAVEWEEMMNKIDPSIVDNALLEIENTIHDVLNNIQSIKIEKDGDEYLFTGFSALNEETEDETEDRHYSTGQIRINKEELGILLDHIKTLGLLDESINTNEYITGKRSNIPIEGRKLKFEELGLDPNAVYGEAEKNIKDIAVQKMYDMINSQLSNDEFISLGISKNKKDVGILKNKKDLPDWYRKLLGEIEDPTANYLETIYKMSNLLEYNKLLHDIKKNYNGTFIFKNQSDKPASYKRVADSGKWNPLNGYYVHPALYDAIIKPDKVVNQEILSQIWSTFNYLTKVNLTKYNMPTHARNNLGAMMMAARLGVTPKEFVKSYGDVWKGLMNGTKEAEEDFNRYQRLGLIDNSVGYGIYKKAYDNSLFSTKDNDLPSVLKKGYLSELSEGKSGYNKKKDAAGRIIRGASLVTESIDKVYLIPDAAVKVATFKKYEKEIAKLYPELSAKEVEDMARDWTLDLTPTYDRMSKASSALAKNPIVGAFASFSLEQLRNNYNQLKISKGLIDEAIKETNSKKELLNHPKLHTGLKMLGTQAGMTMLVPAIASLLKSLFYMDKDDDDLFTSIMPEYQDNHTLIPIGTPGGGYGLWIDLSYTDPQSQFSNILNAIQRRDIKGLDKAFSVGLTSIEPYIGEEALFRTIRAGVENRNSWGKKITNDERDALDHAIERFILPIGKTAIQPGLWRNIERGVKSFSTEKREEDFGRKYNPTTFIAYLLGVNIDEKNVAKLVSYKSPVYQDRYIEQSKLNKEGDKEIEKGNISKGKELKEKANRRRREMAMEIFKNSEAMRRVGLKDEDVKKAFKNLGKGFLKEALRGKPTEVRDIEDKYGKESSVKSYNKPKRKTKTSVFKGGNFKGGGFN